MVKMFKDKNFGRFSRWYICIKLYFWKSRRVLLFLRDPLKKLEAHECSKGIKLDKSFSRVAFEKYVWAE